MRLGTLISGAATAVAVPIMNRRRRQCIIAQRRGPYVWQWPRIRDFWEKIVNEEFTDELWIQHFRMTRDTFNELCDVLERHQMCHAPGRLFRESDRQRLAIALYNWQPALSTG